MIEILSGGILSSIQDRGRFGFRKYGAPTSGALDQYALRLANLLAGNDDDAAAIEVTLSGLKLRCAGDTWIAITGGDLSPRVDNQPVSMWSSLCLKKGEVLSFRQCRSGFRAYVAVRGGIDVPLLMNSRSTMITAALGGTGGPLKTGDQLKIAAKSAGTTMEAKALPERYIPKYGTFHRLRVIPGPQTDYFSAETLRLFRDSEYTISAQSDRQGYRLTGPELKPVKPATLISEAMWPGAIEVPGDGLPIILLADSQPTGGYPKIASVISVDLDRLGQAKPSDRVCFVAVPLEEAAHLIREQEKQMAEIKELLKKC